MSNDSYEVNKTDRGGIALYISATLVQELGLEEAEEIIYSVEDGELELRRSN